MNPSSNEKRKHQRIDKKFVLRVDAEGASSVAKGWTLVTSQNLSAGGVLFTYDRVLKKGTPLNFTIFFPDHSVKCKGEVHRSVAAAQEPLVDVAASIEGLPQKDLDFITRQAA